MPATERTSTTRALILDAAERLFAERGVHSVSHRTIAEAAGQGNVAVVGYHFGTKTGLVRALVRRHTEQVERNREQLLARIAGSRDIRDWVSALVVPSTDHLAELGSPTWCARFSAQIHTDPALKQIVTDESLTSPALRAILEGLEASVPTLPAEIRTERHEFCRHLMVHVLAEREDRLAAGTPTPRRTWNGTATGLIDAITGVWLAPATPVENEEP